MATFDTTAPVSSFYIPPSYADNNDLALLGYKRDGSQNTFGKITSWIPGLGVAQNAAAKKIAKKEGWTDTADNIGDDTDNRINKMMAILKIGGAVGQAVTGNIPGAIGTAKNALGNVMSLQGGGPNHDELNDPSRYGSFMYAEGGSVKKLNDMLRNPPLARGGTRAVQQRQQQLIDAGFKIKADGAWGKETDAAWRQLQGMNLENTYNNLPGGTGLVDEQTPALNDEQRNAITFNRRVQTNIANTENALEGLGEGNSGTQGTITTRPRGVMPIAPTPGGEQNPVRQWYLTGEQNNNPFPAGREFRGQWETPVIPGPNAQRGDWQTPGQWEVPAIPGQDEFDRIPGLTPEQRRKARALYQKVGLPKYEEILGGEEAIPVRNFKSGGKAGSAKKVYKDGDSTEDLYMVDKQVAKDAGLDGVLNRMAFGQMRYGEVIFDQKAAVKIDEMAKTRDYSTLGKFIAQERATHPDQKMFARGGSVNDDPPGKKRQGYSEFNSDTDLNEVTIRPEVAPIPLLNQIAIDPTRPRVNFNSNFNSLQNTAANAAATTAKNTTKALPLAPMDPEPRKIGSGDVLSGLDTVARLALGATAAGKKLPTWARSDRWNQFVNDAQVMSTQGYTPAEMAFGRQQLDDAYDTAANNVAAVSGGASGAYLASLGNLQRSRINGISALVGNDAAVRRLNRNQYGAALVQDNAYDNQEFQTAYQNAAAQKNAGLQLIGATLRDAAERQSYNEAYGPGSTYDNYLKAITEYTQRQQGYSSRIPALLGV